MKLSKNVSAVLLGDSIVAGFLRYHNIWYKLLWNWWLQDSKSITESGKHPSITIAGVHFNQLWHKKPGYRRFWKNGWRSFLYRTCPQKKNESQNCNKWNSTSWWKKYGKKTEIIYSKRTVGSVLITSIPIFII